MPYILFPLSYTYSPHPIPYTIYHISYTRNPNPETRIPKPESRNPNPEARIPKPESRNPNPETRIPEPESRQLEIVEGKVQAVLSLSVKQVEPSEREIFIDNQLVRVHLIIEMSRPALRHGSLNSLFQVALYLPS